ncbi:hypothetical protein [Microbacterium sp. 1.5R]|uniref:hypothetical protein n=1 Tax=Microbacterium sp. 1.5R TaxID=1916917 RepID=UPI0011A5A613|nr:hypothetical protein [Microbacterium sp. 1.5R]
MSNTDGSIPAGRAAVGRTTDGAERRPGDVGAPADSDAQAVITAHLEAREGEGSGELLYVGD